MIQSIRFSSLAAFALPAIFSGVMMAQAPTASAVPFVALNPASPHTSWSGNAVTLKGTMSSPLLGTDSFTFDWDPGDGGAHCAGAVTDPYVIECAHTYSGAVGSLYTAVLVVTDTTNSTVSAALNCPPAITQGACYYTSLSAPPPNLAVEVNNAIDKGLWYLHSHMRRTTSSGVDYGDWSVSDGNATDSAYIGVTSGPAAGNCVAFENSGFLQTITPVNPYNDDVRRCINTIFNYLTTLSTSSPNDTNGNGVALTTYEGNPNYQNGMLLDALVAAGTPNALITPGTALAGNSIAGTGPSGAYTYKDAIFDLVDYYSSCQAPAADDGFGNVTPAGGWHYSCGQTVGDQSASQWAAIGIIPARRKVGAPLGIDPVPPSLLANDQTWLSFSYGSVDANSGLFGYNGPSPIWGPFADTPSGMVQLAMNGKGRGTSVSGTTLWDNAETYMRDNFGNTGGPASAPKDYYYGMLSFTKSMLLHDNSGTGLGNTALSLLQSTDDPGTCAAPGVPVTAPGSGSGPCYPPIDWYAAQTAAYGGSDATDGVARTLVASQDPAGSWFSHNYDTSQYYLETGFAVTMLNRTVFQPVPVACATVNPTNIASGASAILDAACSLDQDPNAHIVSYMWDVSGTNGTNFTIQPGSPQCLNSTCSKIMYNFTLPSGQALPYAYPVKLRVTDSNTPPLTADVTVSVNITAPPNPPSANAGGPYNFCPNVDSHDHLVFAPWLLDGSKSTNPDQGQSEPNAPPNTPPSTIVAYDWDYACSGSYNSAHGSQVNATTSFNQPAFYGTTFNACLRVTNNNDLAFPDVPPASNPTTSVASAQVSIHNTTDAECTHCVSTTGANVKVASAGSEGYIQIYWTDTNTSAQFPIDHYNLYRSSSSTFIPNTQIAGATAKAAGGAGGVSVSTPGGAKLYFTDNKVTPGTTYYYRVAPATGNDTETCNSNVSTLVVAFPRVGR